MTHNSLCIYRLLGMFYSNFRHICRRIPLRSPTPALSSTRCLSATRASDHPAGIMVSTNPDEFQSVLYSVKDRVAHITLNRPHRYNAIDLFMPLELERAVELANLDDSVKAGGRSSASIE